MFTERKALHNGFYSKLTGSGKKKYSQGDILFFSLAVKPVAGLSAWLSVNNKSSLTLIKEKARQPTPLFPPSGDVSKICLKDEVFNAVF